MFISWFILMCLCIILSNYVLGGRPAPFQCPHQDWPPQFSLGGAIAPLFQYIFQNLGPLIVKNGPLKCDQGGLLISSKKKSWCVKRPLGSNFKGPFFIITRSPYKQFSNIQGELAHSWLTWGANMAMGAGMAEGAPLGRTLQVNF